MIEKEINILMVEEDPKEVDCLKEALAVGQFTTVNLQQVEDGEQALAYLRHEHPYLEVPRPDLIFLDLNLPGMSGRELLEEMKQDEPLTSLLVVVLTTSAQDRDLVKTYSLDKNCYFFRKPVSSDQWLFVLHCIEDVWLTFVKFPPESDRSV